MNYRYWLFFALLVALLGKSWTIDETMPISSSLGQQVVPALRNFSPQYSSDGKWVAFLRGTDPQANAELWVMDAEGKKASALLAHESMRYALTLNDLSIHNVPSNTEESQHPESVLPAPQSPFVCHYAWHPTSQSIICQVSSEHGKAGVYQVMLDGTFRQVPHPLGNLYSLSPVIPWGNFLLSSDGKEIAFIGNNGFFHASLDDRDSGEMKWRTGYACQGASWGIDGRIYASLIPRRDGALMH